MKILLVEDDLKLGEHLDLSLRQMLAAKVIWANNLKDLDFILEQSEQYELLILDRLMGNFDTKTWIPRIRKRWGDIGIIILSAINTSNERTELINLGVDDYIGKPFSTQELMARIKALQRRVGAKSSNYIQLGNMVIDNLKRTIAVDERVEYLPAKEFLILKLLTEDPGKVISKNDLLETVWGMQALAETNVVETTMANLRKRLSEMKASLKIKNMRNAGYWIEE